MRSVKVVLERARFIFRSRWRFSFASVEEVESDDDVRLMRAGVLCQELRVGAARSVLVHGRAEEVDRLEAEEVAPPGRYVVRGLVDGAGVVAVHVLAR